MLQASAGLNFANPFFKFIDSVSTLSQKAKKFEIPPKLKGIASALSSKGTIQGITTGVAAGLTAVAVSGFFAAEDDCPSVENEIFSATFLSLITRIAIDAICDHEKYLSIEMRQAIPYVGYLVARNWITGKTLTELIGSAVGSVVKTEYGFVSILGGIAALAVMENPANLDELLADEPEKKEEKKKANEENKKTGEKKSETRTQPLAPRVRGNSFAGIQWVPGTTLYTSVNNRERANREEKKASEAEPPFSPNRHLRGYGTQPDEKKDAISAVERKYESEQKSLTQLADEKSGIEKDPRDLFDHSPR